MALLKWKPEYTVGVAGVDLEHQQLIALINEVYKLLEQNTDSENVDQYLGEIYASISAHFALEESCMRASNYDEYKAHKDDHEELLNQIRDFMDCYLDDPLEGRTLLQQRLDRWFSVHFSSHDARLHRKLEI